MIIRRYLLREVTLNLLGVILLLSVMVLSTTLIRLLDDIIEGSYPADILLALFAIKGIGNLVFIMPLGFFLAVMLTFGRLYRDSEMVVLGACGVRPAQLLGMIGALGMVVALLVSLLSLGFAPWMERYSKTLVSEASVRTDIEGVIPGQFNQAGDGGPVIYAESFDDESRRLHGVFAQISEDGRNYQLTAEQAYEHFDSAGERYLVLLRGYRYEGEAGSREYRIIRFREHGLRIKEREPVASSPPRDGYPTADLLASSDPRDMAELQWRLAMPIGTLLLGLLAVPLSKTTPRRGRFAGLAVGFMIYLIYNNLLLTAKSSLAKGEVPALVGMWWVQLLLLGLVWLLYWRGNRMRGNLKAA
ncbi:MAG TPA: LPS export ABC transporter permease LptF [Gammaproteobacteria bacterium]